MSASDPMISLASGAEPAGPTFEFPEFGSMELFMVDDDESAMELNRSLLERMGYSVQAFNDPLEALRAMKVARPSILLTDVDMPAMSGLELALEAQERDPDIAIILLTGSGDEATAQAALRIGVSDYLTKPPNPEALVRSIQRAFHKRAADEHHRTMVAWMKDELGRKTKALREVTLSAMTSLVNALDARNPHFQGHSRAVAMQAAAVAQAMGLDLDDVEAIRIAGLLHDVGMIAVPDAVVQKPEPLTPAEFDIIRQHCVRGVEILAPMKHLGASIRYVREHHERWDGSGYPDSKVGDEISIGGQILGIAEAWTAILESRAYRAGKSREEGLDMLRTHRGAWFSHEVTDALQLADVGVM